MTSRSISAHLSDCPSQNAHGTPTRFFHRNLRLFAVLVFLVSSCGMVAKAQGLQVTYGSKGVQTIAFNGTLLEDVGAAPADAFHIWHVRSTDLQGNVLSAGQYGWGESNSGETWNSTTNTETYTFAWGTIATQFVQAGTNLNMIVTETNNSGSGAILDGAEIYPFTLHFPADPTGFYGYTQYAITTLGPGVSVADFGSGVVTSVIPNESTPLYGGWKSQGTNAYSPIMTSTAPDGLASFLPSNNAPVQPGTSLTYTVSLRFTAEGTSATAADAYASFAATYPSQMTWTDKRILGTAYLASSPQGGGDITIAGGFPTNPRRYFNDSSVDITTAAGMQNFQNRILSQATNNVSNARALNAQGVITWDIEGEQFPQSTSYVCSPDQISAVAPEMESTILDSTSAFYGRKLDDAYFAIMANAGMRIGLCLRPQVFTLTSTGTASQINLNTAQSIISNLETKARYANSRWGATIFYTDSTVYANGGTLDPAIFQQLITDLPSFLFIPEESTPRYYAYTAPFYSFLFHNDLGTPASTYSFYPNAFGANLVNDVSAATLSTYTPQLTSSVAKGDILMGHADYWQANDPTLLAIYAAAGVSKTPVAQILPLITWNTPASITYGTPLSASQLNASANAPGTIMYTPSAGSTLGVGTDTLLLTFTPADPVNYKSTTATVPLVVTAATPAITWTGPAAIRAGTALSNLQLNALANVPGTFVYTPASGSVPSAGIVTLSARFNPTDATDYNSVTTSVKLSVLAGAVAPKLSWIAPASITYGSALSATQLNATASVTGTFSYSPAVGSLLGAGTSTLTAVFTPANTTSYLPATISVPLNVIRATPVLTWTAPGSIFYGTPLAATQLNAAASIPGSFTYAPASGTILHAGVNPLTATFTPTDLADYAPNSISVPLLVNVAALPVSNLAILSPTAGATVSGSIIVTGYVNLPLDSAGSFLLVDGQEVGTRRVSSGPYVYPLDSTTLSNGVHILQLWAHDIGNNTTISSGITIVVKN